MRLAIPVGLGTDPPIQGAGLEAFSDANDRPGSALKTVGPDGVVRELEASAFAATVATTTSASTLLLSHKLTASSARVIYVDVAVYRTGGARGTGAVGNSASFSWQGCVAMVGAVSGTPTIIGTPEESDYASADLTTAGISLTVAVASGGLVTVTGAGASGLNLTWAARLRSVAATA